MKNHVLENGLQSQYDAYKSECKTKGKTMSDKPWANEPTPLADALWSVEDGEAYVTMNHARNLERRMRAAERLLEDALLTYHNGMTTLQDHTADQIRAHLESARKEDGQ